MNRAAVIILNWNGQSLLEQFLPSVVAHTPAERADIIVADNGSTDKSVAFLSAHYPDIRVIQLDKNYGFAEGYNRAIAQVDHPYTVLLNSDVEVTPGWLDAPLAALDADPSIAAVQPKILAWRDKGSFEYAGAAGGYIDRYGYPFCRGRILGTVERDEGQYDTPADILWASGACLFIRTAVYAEAEGLDARFFAHQEEVDLCWRLRCRGWRLVCTPASVVYHVGGATLSVESPRKTFLNFRNNLLMVYKNLPESDLRRVMWIRRWLDYVAALQFLLTGHPANAKAVLEARREFRRLLPVYAPIRKAYLAQTKLASIPELLDSSLLVAYYLLRRRRFSEIAKR